MRFASIYQGVERVTCDTSGHEEGTRNEVAVKTPFPPLGRPDQLQHDGFATNISRTTPWTL